MVFGNEEVVVYSARKEHLIKPVIDAYTKETGVQVKLITDKAAPLLVRLKAEGKNTPADLFLTVDAGNLWQAAEQGVLMPVTSTRLNANIPAHLRDPKGRWFGLSVRARTIVYNTRKVNPSDLSTYEDLGAQIWKGRLCLRTSKKVYNQSLVAMMISELGEKKSEKIVRSWVGNLATGVFSSDTKVMEAIIAGQCDIGIVNTYYYGRIKRKDPKLPIALFWPNQKGRGVHVNISGGGVTRHTQHRKSAIQLLEWLSSTAAQNLFADDNLEYPVNPTVKPAPAVAAWGSFKPDQINVSKAGELQKDAIKLMDRAGYR
ncbi:MAG: extracellular solute-binding protein [Nitrospira sp.]|nr:extracellular solute-binding protein [Candidatus Manganitrophaceae bacterium]HIL35356.1 extracellular solute-binding protein [Candidatus Manganitrophaceae bacterium]